MQMSVPDREPDMDVSSKTIIETIDLDFYYVPEEKALKNVNIQIPEKKVTAFIGPSGCGKSTLLRC